MRKSKPLVIVSVRPPAVAEMGQADPFRRHHLDAFFTARCYASAVLALGLCPSVCLCLCLTQAGVLIKRQNIGSHKQHHTIPQGL